MDKIINGLVINVIDNYTVEINIGRKHGVRENSVFLIYYIGDEIIDPVSHKSLGELEIPCGEGKVKHLQQTMTTIESNQFDRTIKKPLVLLPGSVEGEEVPDASKWRLPFHNISIGCLAKIIK